MKELVIVFLVFCLMGSSSVQKGPEIRFETLTFDFGKIPQGRPVTKGFFFKVIDPEPVSIKNVLSNCGCLTTNFPDYPIMPGHAGEVRLTFNAAMLGRFDKAATVRTETSNEEFVLRVTGEVIAQPE